MPFCGAHASEKHARTHKPPLQRRRNSPDTVNDSISARPCSSTLLIPLAAASAGRRRKHHNRWPPLRERISYLTNPPARQSGGPKGVWWLHPLHLDSLRCTAAAACRSLHEENPAAARRRSQSTSWLAMASRRQPTQSASVGPCRRTRPPRRLHRHQGLFPRLHLRRRLCPQSLRRIRHPRRRPRPHLPQTTPPWSVSRLSTPSTAPRLRLK